MLIPRGSFYHGKNCYYNPPDAYVYNFLPPSIIIIVRHAKRRSQFFSDIAQGTFVVCILCSISAHSMFTAVLFCYQKNNIVKKLLNQELTFD